MNTCPGASHSLSAATLDSDLIRAARITFLEGYLWGPERPREAMLEAARIAHCAERKVAFTLSSSLQIGNRRKGVLGMIEQGLVDILFGNDHEIMHLTGLDDLGDAIEALSRNVGTLVVTRGEHGAIGRSNGATLCVPATSVSQIVDTTGAGDLFAGGVLAAMMRGQELEQALHIGAIAAGEIISHYGARPQGSLKELVGW